MGGRKAIDIAKIFISENINGLDDTFNGNMKMNKLLYFAQLISLAIRNDVLFEDSMFAFKNGVVIESVRKEYKDNYTKLIDESKSYSADITDEEKKIISITKDIFGSIESVELSELTHQHEVWKYYYNKSKENSSYGYCYNTNAAKININDFCNKFMSDIENIKDVMSSYFDEEEESEIYIELNGIKYYYDPTEIIMNNEMLNELENFSATDKAYSIYIDERQGLVVY